MAYDQGELSGRDGLRLHTRRWRPEAEPRAVVILSHGMGEQAGRYVHVGKALSARGYALYGFDMRGHGRSAGLRGHTPGYAALLDDLQQVWDWARGENPGKRLFLYGHSFGGQIALNFALDRRPPAAGLIVSTPLLQLTYMPPAWKVRLAMALAAVWPTFMQSTGLDTAVPMSHDAAHLSSLPDIDLNHPRISARMGVDLLRYAEVALARAGELTLPLLVLHGEADGATSPAGSRQLYEQARSVDKTLRMYPGMYHEIHNETDRAVVLRDLADWLDAH